MRVGWGPSAPCLETHPLGLAPARATPLWSVYRSGPSGHLLSGSREGAGVGATAPELCCPLVDSHKKQLEGRGHSNLPHFLLCGLWTSGLTQGLGMGRHLQGQPPTPSLCAPGPQNPSGQSRRPYSGLSCSTTLPPFRPGSSPKQPPFAWLPPSVEGLPLHGPC